MIRRLGLTSPITWFSPDSYRGEAKNEAKSLSQKYASSALFRIPRKSNKRPSIRREMQALLKDFLWHPQFTPPPARISVGPTQFATQINFHYCH